MKRPFAISKATATRCLAIVLTITGILATVPLLSGARTPATTSITVVNNSSAAIRHIYLSPTNEETWGADQLESSTISPGGGALTLSISCSAADIKVIAEDADGCFLNQIVACGQSTTWTIANDSGRNCGS